MKKYKIVFLVFIYLFLFITNVYASENITIIEAENISSDTIGKAEEISPATFEGLNINFNAKFYEVGDSLSYKIVIQNNSNKDYELDIEIPPKETDYISYTINYDKDSNILRKNSVNYLYITIKYIKEVPKNEFESSIKKITNQVSFVLSKDEKITNPETKSNIGYIIVLIIAIFLIIGQKKYKKVKKYIWLIIPFMFITMVYANEKIIITITPNIEIEETYLLSLKKGKDFVKEINGESITFTSVGEIPSYFGKRYKKDEKININISDEQNLTNILFKYETNKEIDYCEIPVDEGIFIDYDNKFINDDRDLIYINDFKNKYNNQYSPDSLYQYIYYSFDDIEISLYEIANMSMEDSRMQRIMELLSSDEAMDKISAYIKMPPQDLNLLVLYKHGCN